MENELRYSVRSREIVDLVTAMRSSRLTLSSYFQRNLVWREAHKRDFIDTILKGYPFPQIFLARGPIDLDTMSAIQCVVDGQQRLNTIQEFVSGKLEVNGRFFSDLFPKQKEEFLKYEVAVIDFDLDAGDTRLKEIFHRLNRTYYSLTAIEKLASEYSASEFLLVARVLCGEVSNQDTDLFDEYDDGLQGDEHNPFLRDPGIDDATWKWMTDRADGPYAELIRSEFIFTRLEFDRKVPLMFTLNIMCTYLSGYYSRNDKVRRYLDDKNSYFAEKDEIVEVIDDAARMILAIDLPEGSMWWNKANFFTLVCELITNRRFLDLDTKSVRELLINFEVSPDYALAAREAIGRKRERELRGSELRKALSDFAGRTPGLSLFE